MNQMTPPGPDDPICSSARDGAVQVIWMNEPARRNPLSMAMRELLLAEVTGAMENPEVRAIVLTGADGCFCAGGDIAGMTDMHPAKSRQRLRNIHRLVRLIHGGPKPVIAAVEGWAVGAGLSIASLCDIVVAASDARFSLPFAKIGLAPDLGVLHTLPARIGIGRTRWLALTGKAIDVATASAWGLVEDVAEPGQALARAVETARTVAAGAPLSQMMTRQMLARLPLGFEEFLSAEADMQALLFSTRDFAEGQKAFMEKRQPAFRGE